MIMQQRSSENQYVSSDPRFNSNAAALLFRLAQEGLKAHFILGGAIPALVTCATDAKRDLEDPDSEYDNAFHHLGCLRLLRLIKTIKTYLRFP